MAASDGGLPQRPPRVSKRRKLKLNPRPTVSDAPCQPAKNAEASSPKCQHRPDAASCDEVASRHAPGENADFVSDRHTEGCLRSARVTGYNFEYLDHTADVQLHAWGLTYAEAFEQVALAMFNYMTPLSGIQLLQSRTIKAKGHDMHSLLFHFLDELLYVFSTELFVPATFSVESLDLDTWSVTATGHGEVFDRRRHVSGTEVKAITYSAMAVTQQEDVDIFVIVDI